MDPHSSFFLKANEDLGGRMNQIGDTSSKTVKSLSPVPWPVFWCWGRISASEVWSHLRVRHHSMYLQCTYRLTSRNFVKLEKHSYWNLLLPTEFFFFVLFYWIIIFLEKALECVCGRKKDKIKSPVRVYSSVLGLIACMRQPKITLCPFFMS